MAYAALVILQLGISLWKNAANSFTFNPVAPDTTPVDVSGWNTLTLFLFAPVNGENLQLGHIDLTGKAAFSSPQIKMQISNSDMTSLNLLPSGNYGYVILGKPSSGDDYQAIVQGTCALTAPDDTIPSP